MAERFRTILSDFRFLPGGRILAGAGTPHSTTLFNCFVMGAMEDSIQGIFNTLRPAGASAAASGGVASGPLSFMDVWEEASTALESCNLRGGALMATLPTFDISPIPRTLSGLGRTRRRCWCAISSG